MSQFDVYSYGMISSSTLHMLEDSFPSPDAYAEIKDSYYMTGGEAANSSIVLSKLAVKMRLDGNWLGNDDNGLRTLSFLKDFNIDTDRLDIKDNYKGVQEIVIADKNTRTIFGSYCKLLFNETQWNYPLKEDISSARIVCLDPFFKEASLQVSRYCRELDVPYVTIDCKYDDEISKNADVIIISGEFRGNQYKDSNLPELFSKYQQNSRGLVIFTSGHSDILYGIKGGDIKKMAPLKIKPLDTAGAGDSFRSGIIYGMLKKWPWEKTLNFAAILAAYICQSFPGVINSPDYSQLEAYAYKNSRTL